MDHPLRPSDVVRSFFHNSPFNDSLIEWYLRCLVVIQFRMNESVWTPFTWEEYVSYCQHEPTQDDYHLLEALVAGGQVSLTDMGVQKAVTLKGGYLQKDGDRYVVAEPLLEVLAPYADPLPSNSPSFTPRTA